MNIDLQSTRPVWFGGPTRVGQWARRPRPYGMVGSWLREGSISLDKTGQLWDTKRGKFRWTLTGNTDSV